MKLLLSRCAWLFVAFASFAAFGQQKALSAAEQLAAIVQQRVTDSETPACIAVGMVEAKTHVAFACSSGAGPAPPDRDSLFEIGSISKGLTGFLLADMVRSGEVSLDDPASKYSRPGARLPSKDGREITLRDLVTHTSGLPRLPPGFSPADYRNPYADFNVDALYAALARTELNEIGTTSQYSNFGFMWLSEMLARKAGKTYEAALMERILEPLGMRDTRLVPTSGQRKRVVIGHDLFYEPVSQWDVQVNLAGVGGLRSSLDDMLKLAEALAGQRVTRLKDTVALAVEPMRPAFGKNSTGYGWVTREGAENRVHWHNGATGGFRSMIAVNERTKTAAVVLVDSAVPFDDLALHLVDSSVPLRKKRIGAAVDASVREQYTGRYETSPTFAITVFVEHERLMAQGTGQRAHEILSEAADSFFSYTVDGRLKFLRSADGKVEGLTLFQAGREIQGRRTQ